MKDLKALNEALTRIDSQYRHGRIDRIEFRRLRREILLGGPPPDSPTRTQSRLLDADPSVPTDVTLDRSALNDKNSPGQPGTEKAGKGKKRFLGIATTVAMVALLAAGGVVFLQTESDRAATPATTAEAGPSPTAALQAELVIANLLNSDWSDDDLNRFLESWSSLPKLSITAAKGKQRIWTLRSQVEQRLREANDAASIDPSEEATRRVNLLELIAIRIGT